MSLLSISTHLGALISSRLIAPKDGATILQKRMISSVSFESITSGHESISANRFINKDFPSITGSAASAPISPSPKTAVPSLMTATVFARFV